MAVTVTAHRYEMNSTPDMERAAVLSSDGRYRYRLWRAWGPGERLAFVMLNPSTADGIRDDPTIRRCIGFARREGFDGIDVVNLYAWRATHPSHLLADMDDDVVEGVDNPYWWCEVLAGAKVGKVVAAWGAWRPYRNGAIVVSRALRDCGPSIEWWSLGVTRAGHPRHPLYVPADQPLERWKP